MSIGVLASGGLGLSVLKECMYFLHPAFIATDSKSTGIIDFATQNSIPLFKGNPREGRLKNFLIGKGKVDIIISLNYLFLIEKDIIASAKYVINFHGSLLPLYRGRTPHVWAIINNEKKTGITAHLIDEDCDTGDIILQKEVPIESEDTGNDILAKYSDLYPRMLKEIIDDLIDKGRLTTYKQDHSKSTWFGKRTQDDGLINWDWQKERIKNWVRAQAHPYPGAFSYIEGNKVIIDRVDFSDVGFQDSMANGLILQDDAELLVKTQNGVIKLLEVRVNRQICIKGKKFNHGNSEL